MLLTVRFFAFSQINFTIKGHLQNESSSNKVFLQGDISETLPLENHKTFLYSGTLPKPGLLLIKTEKTYAWAIWVNEGNIDVTLKEYYRTDSDSADKKLLKVISIAGPPETEKYQWF